MSIAEFEEDGVRIALNVVDTPGFGDNIDNEFACVASLCCLPRTRPR
jgi:septin family protein